MIIGHVRYSPGFSFPGVKMKESRIRLSASDGSSSEKLTAKAHMIEGILADRHCAEPGFCITEDLWGQG